MDDPQPNFKHYCRVCKKGFMCGRALGGHMRAHGIGDDTGGYVDDDDPGNDWEEKGNEKSHNKRIYQLRTNPNKLKSCRNCGKEFLSWKSFLEHGKCSSDDASESLVSSQESYGDEDDGDERRGGGRGGWLKRKRSLRSKVGYVPTEDDDLLLARCLVQLANTVVDPSLTAAEPEESCASASREEDHRRNTTGYSVAPQPIRAPYDYKAKGVSSPAKGVFECKACKKVFNSHQALGGHRASHKKVKGCYAAKQDITEDQVRNHNSNFVESAAIAEDEVINNDEFFRFKPVSSSYQYESGGGGALIGSARRKSKVHECSICHRVFPSGQALGGHKRCHWITSNSPETSSIPKFHFPENNNNNNTNNVSEKLNLNVPTRAHVSGVQRDPNNPLRFEVFTDMHLEIPSCRPPQIHLNPEDNMNRDEKVVDVEKNGVDDEAASDLKLSRLSDLNDMGNSCNSSQWLQVGIGSATQAATADS